MKNTYKDPIETIHHSISTGEYDTLSDILDQIYSTGGRSAAEKTAICFGYSVLAGYLGQGDPVNALQAHDRARQMFPGDRKLLQREIDFLKEFIDSNKKCLTNEDCELLRKTINLIKRKAPRSYTNTVNKICEPLIFELNHLIPQNEVGYNLNLITGGMLYIIHGDLNVKEQVEKFSELITPILMEKLARDQKKKKEAKKKKVKAEDS